MPPAPRRATRRRPARRCLRSRRCPSVPLPSSRPIVRRSLATCKRLYRRGVHCPEMAADDELDLLAHALAVVGDRWTLVVIGGLLAGPQRYGDLQARVPAIAPNIL